MDHQNRLPDWTKVQSVVFAKSRETIMRFAAEHPEEKCSFFAFGLSEQSNSSLILLCFDTLENARASVQESLQTVQDTRRTMLNFPEKWRSASQYLDQRSITPYSQNIDYFKYFDYDFLSFDDWIDYDGIDIPQRQALDDDYFEGNMKIVLWRVLEQLIAEDVFSALPSSTLFLLGYQIPEEPIVILNILHLP